MIVLLRVTVSNSFILFSTGFSGLLYSLPKFGKAAECRLPTDISLPLPVLFMGSLLIESNTELCFFLGFRLSSLELSDLVSYLTSLALLSSVPVTGTDFFSLTLSRFTFSTFLWSLYRCSIRISSVLVQNLCCADLFFPTIMFVIYFQELVCFIPFRSINS